MKPGRARRFNWTALRFAYTVVLGSLAIACTSPAAQDRSSTDGPTVLAVDTLVLVETDSLYLARPLALYRDPTGGFYVSDLFRNRVVLYDVAGNAGRIFGRPGGGPGELRQVSFVFVRDDSTVAVFDISKRLINLYDRNTAVFRKTVQFEGIGLSIQTTDEATWFGAMQLGRGTAVARWKSGSQAVEYFIPMPEAYFQSRLLAGNYAGAWVAVWEDTLAVVMTGADTVRLFTTTGSKLDAIRVPVRRRRGVPLDIVDQMQPRRGLSTRDRFALASAVMGLYRQSDGTLLLIHADQSIDGRLITADVFVSLISPDRTRACVDTQLAVSKDAQPLYTFYADTLFVLEQRIGDNDNVRTSVTSYRIDGDRCDWIQITR